MSNDKQALIDKCRYYKGEETCPDRIEKQGKKYLWFYESKWVELKGNYDDPGEYDEHGLTSFEENDGVPVSLKKMLFNRFIEDVYDLEQAVKNFKIWYKKEYTTYPHHNLLSKL